MFSETKVLYSFPQEDREGSWQRLLTEVLAIFIEKHIFKSLSPDLPIYQVFCIRQLLKWSMHFHWILINKKNIQLLSFSQLGNIENAAEPRIELGLALKPNDTLYLWATPPP